MKFDSRIFILSLMLTMLVNIAHAADLDVSGDWELTVETEAGSGSPKMHLEQEGNAITGTYSSPTFGEASVKGVVNVSNVSLNVTINAQGQELTIEYSGSVEGSSIQGNVSLGGFGQGTFVGKKI